MLSLCLGDETLALDVPKRVVDEVFLFRAIGKFAFGSYQDLSLSNTDYRGSAEGCTVESNEIKARLCDNQLAININSHIWEKSFIDDDRVYINQGEM